MPQYAILLYAPVDDEDETVDDDEAREGQSEGMREHDRYSQELQDEGVMIAAFGLESHESATSIRAEGITDGPFIESKEVVLGVCIVEAPDLDAALAIARRNPILHQGGGIEVRPIAFLVVPTRANA
jgi:hypothetical protein